MKKRYLFTMAFYFLCFVIYGQAPTYQWTKNFGDASCVATTVVAVTTDNAGNVFVCGSLNGTADFDPGPGTAMLTSNSTNDLYFGKYSSAGNLIWAKLIVYTYILGYEMNFGSTGIKTDAQGNVYISGYYNDSNMDFDPGPATATMPHPSLSGDYGAGFIAKYDSNGNYMWSSMITASNTINSEKIYGLAVDTINGVIRMIGQCNAYSAYSDNVRYNTTNLFPVSGGNPIGFVISCDLNGNLVTTNSSTVIVNSNTFAIGMDNAGNYCISSVGGTNYYLKKFTPAALTGFSKIIPGLINGISFDGSGDVYITGYFSGTADFDPDAGVYNLTSGSGNNDAFIGKYSGVNGALNWAGNIGSSTTQDMGYSCSVVDNAYVFATGYFSATGDFDISVSAYNMTSVSSQDAYIVKYDLGGNFQWAGQMGIASSSQRFMALAKYPAGDFILGGHFTNTEDFDFSAGTANITAVSSGNGYNAFIARYSACAGAPSQPGTISGITTVCSGSTNSYSISPVSGATSYNWVLPGGWGGTSTTTSINATAGSTGGNITVTAINACGSSIAQVTAVTVSAPSLTLSATDASCFGSCDGSINASTTGGISPYTYSSPLTNLCANTYTVTVTDAMGCTAQQAVPVSSPTQLAATSGATPPGYCAGSCAQLVCTPAGGSPGYNYSWSPAAGLNSDTINNPQACPAVTTTYTCTVTDSNSCTTATTIVVTVNAIPAISYTQNPTLVCINWTPVTLSSATPAGGVYSGAGVTGNQFDPAAAGTGTWNVMYTYADSNGCADSVVQQITVDLCVGLSENTAETEIIIYPNPFSSRIMIMPASATGRSLTRLTITNTIGELISDIANPGTKTEFDLSAIPPGIYLLRVETAEGIVTRKLVKE